MARSALYALLLTACAALRLAPAAPRLHAGRRRAFALAPRALFGGAPPEEESKPAAPARGWSANAGVLCFADDDRARVFFVTTDVMT